ncbi:MAG: 50S ribosomal protein L13 [Candidatus Margulisiibacteriota bacterium]
MKKKQTVFAREGEVKRRRYLLDAQGKVLGRLATKVATYLRGKHKPIYTPHVDCGDYVVVVNAEKVKVTGKKIKQKVYFTHSGFPGGDRILSFEKMITKCPEKVIELAVKGMLPHNRLGAKMIRKLKIYRGERPELKNWERLEV